MNFFSVAYCHFDFFFRCDAHFFDDLRLCRFGSFPLLVEVSETCFLRFWRIAFYVAFCHCWKSCNMFVVGGFDEGCYGWAVD